MIDDDEGPKELVARLRYLHEHYGLNTCGKAADVIEMQRKMLDFKEVVERFLAVAEENP